MGLSESFKFWKSWTVSLFTTILRWTISKVVCTWWNPYVSWHPLIFQMPSHQKYLKLLWKGRLYQFTYLAQRLSCAPRVFTKLLKPVYSHLRLKGHVSSGYLDDSFLEGDSHDACLSNVQDTLTLLGDLGFCPNLDKSVVQPTHVLEHLGFILNSLDMSVSISDCNFRKFLDKADKILQCTIFLSDL